MSSIPIGHPTIPDEVHAEDIVAIVTVHDPEAPNANRTTPFRKSGVTSQRANGQTRRTVKGSHIFLHRIEGQYCYSLGRGDSRSPSGGIETRDIYFPSTQAGMNQLVLIPIWKSDCWRLQSVSETVTTVNGAPIQHVINRAKTYTDPLPHAIHLKQDTVNRITINGLRIDIWLMKTVREIYPTEEFSPSKLRGNLQDVVRRPEPWARDRYLMGREQVSARSHRVVERFTSEMQTAKLFRDQHHGRRLRDEEFRKFSKDKVDTSIVQYIQSVEIDSIPAIITSTHDGLVSYAALQADIKNEHPGARFAIAAKLLRRVMFALEFLHFHGIVHGHVSHESVLLRLVNHKATSVLLVNYSNASSFTIGAPAPSKDMIADGRAVVQIVEDCCDIWQLRKAATKDAMAEAFMRRKTETAQKEVQSVQRVVSDFFGPKGGSRESDIGKKLLRLLELKSTNWQSAQDNQMHNGTRREIGTCYKSSIVGMVQDWEKTHPPSKIGEKQYMILTLGHDYFDSLPNQLYHERWDTTPQEVCAKFKELAGDVEDPWQTFEVKKFSTFIQQEDSGFDELCILEWLAGCCEAYPEWRQTIELEFERNIRPGAVILHNNIERLRDALETYGTLPLAMIATFRHLTADNEKRQDTIRVQETHHIPLHTPSRMFNLTYLQRLVSPDRFLLCVNDGRIRCDNYVEVRGEPKIQGCYVPLSLLHTFADQLGMIVPHDLDHTPLFPTYDPSDFSQVSGTRIVLAHTGLLAFASVSRTGNQFNFHAPKFPSEFHTINTFLPTYFGDMKVLPRIPEGGDISNTYPRPDHWSKFKTADELEGAAKVGKRKVLKPNGPLEKLATGPSPTVYSSTPPLSMDMDVDESALTQILKQRERIRAEAHPPTKRNTNAQSSEPSTPHVKRHQSADRISALPGMAPDITTSFVNRAVENMERMARGKPAESSLFIPRIPNTSFFQRDGGVNQNVLSSPPRLPLDKTKSFTIPVGSFDLGDDWKQAEEWLKHMPAEEEESPKPLGLEHAIGFHHQPSQEETARKKGGNGKAAGVSFAATEATEVATPSQSFVDDLQDSPAAEAVSPTPTRKSKEHDSLAFSAPRQPGPGYATPDFSSPGVPYILPLVRSGSIGPGGGSRHNVSISDLAGVSLGTGNTQSFASSPVQPFVSCPAQPFASSPAQPTQSFPAPGVQNDFYSSPGGVINNWFRDQARVAQDEDDDMPDTDVESFHGDD